MSTASEKLELAQSHLKRAQLAWDPPEWVDLSIYGFYALEAAVEAACLHYSMHVKRVHWAKADAAETLFNQHGLEDVSDLLRDLNETRKSVAYGDVEAPELDAENVVSRIELYIDSVTQLAGE